jgi:hypothetical protein
MAAGKKGRHDDAIIRYTIQIIESMGDVDRYTTVFVSLQEGDFACL